MLLTSLVLRSGRTGLILLSAAAGLIAAGAAVAQDRPPPPRGGDGFRAPGNFGVLGGNTLGVAALSHEQLDRYLALVKLSPEQKERVNGAFNAYIAQYDAEEAAMQERMDAAREKAEEDGTRNPFQAMIAPAQEFRESAERMEKDFFAQFKRALTKEQAESWDKVERARRRDRAAAGMMVASGERTDLVRIVEDMRMTPEILGTLTPTLQQYESELDGELIARAKVNDEVAAAFAEMRNNPGQEGQGQGGPGAMMAMMEKVRPILDKARDASSRVQEVNRRYAAKIQSQLPEDRRARFAKAVKESRFPDVYREGPAGRQLGAALEMTNLTDSQRQTIRSLQAQYVRDMEDINEKLAVASEKDEAQRNAGGMGFPGGGRAAQAPQPNRQGGQGGQRGAGNQGRQGGRPGGQAAPRQMPQSFELRRDKRDLERSTIEDLAKILTPEQVEKLPQPEGRDRFLINGPEDGRQRQGGGQGGDARRRN